MIIVKYLILNKNKIKLIFLVNDEKTCSCIIDRFFKGALQSEITCSQCGYVENRNLLNDIFIYKIVDLFRRKMILFEIYLFNYHFHHQMVLLNHRIRIFFYFILEELVPSSSFSLENCLWR